MKRLLRPALAVAFTLGASASALAGSYTLQGRYVEFGVSDNGALIDLGSKVGLRFDPTGQTNFTGRSDVVNQGLPYAFYSLGTNYAATSAIYTSNTFNSTTTRPNPASLNLETSGGTFGGLRLTQRMHLDPNRTTLAVDVELVNFTQNPVDHVVYAVGLDPDLDNGNGFSTGTINTLGDRSVTATGPLSKNFIRLEDVTVAPGVQPAVPSIRAGKTTDPYNLLIPANDGAGQAEDNTINLAYDVGSMAPGASRLISYNYVLGPAPEPAALAMLPAGLALVGGLALRRRRRQAS